jgi:chromosome segregation ATPase
MKGNKMPKQTKAQIIASRDRTIKKLKREAEGREKDLRKLMETGHRHRMEVEGHKMNIAALKKKLEGKEDTQKLKRLTSENQDIRRELGTLKRKISALKGQLTKAKNQKEVDDDLLKGACAELADVDRRRSGLVKENMGLYDTINLLEANRAGYIKCADKFQKLIVDSCIGRPVMATLESTSEDQ